MAKSKKNTIEKKNSKSTNKSSMKAKASKEKKGKEDQISALQNELTSTKKELKTIKKELIGRIDELSEQVIQLKQLSEKTPPTAIAVLEKKFSKQKEKLKQQTKALATEHDEKIQQLKQSILEKVQRVKETAPEIVVRKSEKVNKEVGLIQIKGVGPVTVKKMQEYGINTLDDLINAPKQTLDKFKAIRGSETWVQQAKALRE